METAREMLLSAGLWGVASATPEEWQVAEVEKWAAALEARARDNAIDSNRTKAVAWDAITGDGWAERAQAVAARAQARIGRNIWHIAVELAEDALHKEMAGIQPRNWRHKPTEPGWYWRVRLGDQHPRTPDVVLVMRDNDHERSALYWTDYGMAHPVDDPPAYWMRIPEPELPGPPEALREVRQEPDGTTTIVAGDSVYTGVTFPVNDAGIEPAVGHTVGDWTDPDTLARALTDLEMEGYTVIHIQTVTAGTARTPVTRVVWRCTGGQP